MILLLLPGLLTLEIKEIHNPILPVQIGLSRIITSKHTFLYHINITYPLEISNKIFNELLQLKNSFGTHNHFSIIINDKINHAIKLNKLIINQLEVYSKTRNRSRKALINAVGKISKWIFGTLDSDDGKYYNNYLNTLNENQIKLNLSLSKHHTVLEEMSEKYLEHFNVLEENQITISNQIKLITKEIDKLLDIEQAFSLNVIIDNLIIQLQNTQNLINNIDTAISFAKLNILHSSIINPQTLESVITKLNEIYKTRNVPILNNFMNYYSLFSTQVTVQAGFIIFKVHTPIINNTSRYFQLYPIPLNNLTIIPEQPFLILNDYGEDWTTSDRCPEIENHYYCPLHLLRKNKQPCLSKIIKTGENECSSIVVHLNKTIITQINANQLIVIPTKSFKLKSDCDNQGIYKISQPSIINIGKCQINADGKIYQKEETIHEEKVFELPSFNFTSNIIKLPMLHLKTLNHEDIEQIKTLAHNIQPPQLEEAPSVHSWMNSTLIVILIIIILCFFVIVYFKTFLPRRKKENQKTPNLDSENKDPLFSELKEGGII